MPKVITDPVISFQFQTPFRLTGRSNIREVLTKLAKKEKSRIESLTYVFCTDDYLLDINRRFLKHDFYTDIITFDMGGGGNSAVIGEIYISVDRVKENAKTHDVTIQNELLRVIFHGALHLSGYKDKSSVDISRMRKAEERYLAIFHKMFHVKHG